MVSLSPAVRMLISIACAVLYDFGAERGDEIIMPALPTFVATGNAVLQAGFTPVFIDVERETLNIEPQKDRAGHHSSEPEPSCQFI